MFSTGLRRRASRIALLPLLACGIALPALAQDGYRLKPGDVVQVEVLEDPTLNRSVLVLPDGSLSFPQVGTITAGGRTVEQLRQALTGALAPNFASTPNVYTSVASLASPTAAAAAATADVIRVYVMGEVESPGAREIEKDSNLLQFLAQSGSLTRFAARKRIELHRVDPATRTARVYLFDLDAVGGGPNRISGVTPVAEGDVIVVPTRRLFE